MRHNYKHLLAYDPALDKVTVYKFLGEEYIFEERMLDEAFYEVLSKTNRMDEMVLGFSLTGDMYQLAPAGYGTYVKEDLYSTQMLSKGKVLRALAKYKMDNNIKFEEY